MARLAVTVEEDLLKMARQAAAKLEVSLSTTVEDALKRLVAQADLQAPIDWPAPASGTRPLSATEICDAINEGRE